MFRSILFFSIRLVTLCSLVLACSILHAQESVLISEILADNESTSLDEDGDTADWIELYNPTAATIHLEGFTISDNSTSWTFPAIALAPDSYLLVFASDKDRSTGLELHTNFKLSKDGEQVQIHDLDNNLVESITYPALSADISYGRDSEDLNSFREFTQPTPGAENKTIEIAADLYRIISSHESGFYPDGLSAFLYSERVSDEIYYTLDGSLPNKNSIRFDPVEGVSVDEVIELPDFAFTSTSYVWEEPANDIPRATVLRAVAYNEDTRVSEILNQSFWITQNPHTLPIVSLIGEEADFFDEERGIYIEGKGKNGEENFFMTGRDWERPIHVSFFDNKGDFFLQQEAGIRVAGANTRLQPQKAIRLYARSDYGKSTFDHPFWGEDYGNQFKRITFRTMNVGSWSVAGFQDDLIHDIIDGEIDADYVRRNFSIVYLNGVYWGVHSMREHNNQHFIERNYGIPEDDVITSKALVTESETPNNFDDLVNDIFNLDLTKDEDYSEVASRLDIVKYTDYIITNIAFANRDWPHNNVEFWYSDEYDGKVRFIINDLDATMTVHNDERLELFIMDQATRLDRDKWVRVLVFMQKLLEVPAYRQYFNSRMNQLLHSTFAPSNTLGVLERMVQELSPEMNIHIRRWHHPDTVDKWEAAVDRLREFLLRRPLYLVERSNELFGFPIDAYPNPTGAQMDLEFNAWTDGDLHIELTDVSGRVVLQQSYDILEGPQQINLNLQQIPTGSYILTARYGGIQINKRIMKVAE